MSRWRRILPLAVCTLLIWTSRLRNLVTDPSPETDAQASAIAWGTASVFVAAGLYLAWRLRSTRATGLARNDRTFVRTFAAVTIGYWLVRAVQIAADDHATSFVVVHSLLAVVLIVTSGLAIGATRLGIGAGTDPMAQETRQFQSVE